MNAKKYTDKQIIEAIRSGGTQCEAMMAYLYPRYVNQIIAFVRERGGKEAEAEDIYQDAIVNLLLAIQDGRFEGRSAVSTYLFAISKNLWYRRFRRHNLEDDYRATLPGDEQDANTPEVLLLEADQHSLLFEVLDQLKDKCREVLGLWSQKYNMKEIAERLGYQNDQVVRNKKNLCLKELKNKLRDQPALRTVLREMLEQS
ncbi:MAG: sigma-70 family RNA polymerase sigma factor [Bacteroidota bacterium]